MLPTLPTRLRTRILARLGVSRPRTANLDVLRTLYGAWCTHVPFDNVRKMIALRSGDAGRLPGNDAVDFFERWLSDGCGGTCWPTSNALYTLVTSLGFDARRLAGSMRDCGMVNHGSVKVSIDGRDWLVDPAMLTGEPLPLGHGPFANEDPIFGVEIEPTAGTHVVWFDVPPHPDFYPCRLLPQPVDHNLCEDMYERSRLSSPFNAYLYARRNGCDEMVVIRGPILHRRNARGTEARTLTPDEVCAALRNEIGISETLINQWVACGALDATFVPWSGPPPPPLARVRPSRRQ